MSDYDYYDDEMGGSESQDEAPSLAKVIAALMAKHDALLPSASAPFAPQRAKRKRSLADMLGEGANSQRYMLDYPWGALGFSPDASEVHGIDDQVIRPMPGMVPVFKMPDVYHGPVAPQGIERQGGPSRVWLAGPKHFEL